MSDAGKGALLVVDDEPLKRFTLQIELTEAGYKAYEASDAPSALKQINTHPIDVVITDLRMPEMDGLELLERIKAHSPQTHVILMTAFGSVDSAVDAIKRGAYDYIAKPFNTETLLDKLERLFACHHINQNTPNSQVETLGPLVGQSYIIRKAFEQIRHAAQTDRPVLILGENGTGKEQMAEAVHQLSSRSQRPLIKFSCSTSGSDILDAELFGASASAGPLKVGRLELASGGSIFLNEIDAMPPELQAKLLRVLERKIIERPGSTERTAIDTRVICATSKDLQQMVENKKFREDLYYRLSAMNLYMPPLRERPEDIPILTNRILKNLSAHSSNSIAPLRINPHAMDALTNYHWPGNIRELEQVLERAATNAENSEIQPKDIILPTYNHHLEAQSEQMNYDSTVGLTETIAGVERTLINAALRRASGNQAKAAQFLRIPRTTLRDKMAKYGLFNNHGKHPQEIEQ